MIYFTQNKNTLEDTTWYPHNQYKFKLSDDYFWSKPSIRILEIENER